MSDTYKTKTLDLKIKIKHIFDHDADCDDIGTFSSESETGAIDRWEGVVLGKYVADIYEQHRIILDEKQLEGYIDFDKESDWNIYTADWDKIDDLMRAELKKRNVHIEDWGEHVSPIVDEGERTLEISYEGYLIVGHCKAEHTERDRRFFVSANYDYEEMMEYYLTNHTHINVEGSPTQRIIDYDDSGNPIVYTEEQAREKVVKGILAAYEVVRSWYNDDWHYFGIVATVEDEDENEFGHSSYWGYSSDMESKDIEDLEKENIHEAMKDALKNIGEWYDAFEED